MKRLREEVEKNREMENEVDPLFLNRWSPRAMTGEKIDKEELMSLFEAARWAPSSYNNQSWRFVYAERDSEYWEDYLDLLVDANRRWAKEGSVLIVILSKTTFDYNDEYSRTHSFDTGAAWENLALEGARRGLVVHGMQGFDYEKAKEVVDAPEEFEVEAMAVVGVRGNKEELPEDLKESEEPNTRKPVEEIAREGKL